MPPEELLRELLPILQERYGMDASTPEAIQAIERIKAGDMQFIGELTGDIGSLQTGGHLAAQMGLGATSMLDQFAKSAKLAPRVLGSLAPKVLPRLAGLTTIPGIAANVGLGAYGLLNLLQGASRVDDVGLFGRGEESTVDGPVMQAIESPAGQMAFGGLDVGIMPQLRSALRGVFRRGGAKADDANEMRIEFADDAGEAAEGSVIRPTVQPGQQGELNLDPLNFDETTMSTMKGVESGSGGSKNTPMYRPLATTESMTVAGPHGTPITTSGTNVGRRFPSQRNERGQEINRIRFADEGRPLDDPHRNLEGDATPIQTFREFNRYKPLTSTRNVSPTGRQITPYGWKGKSRYARNQGAGPSGVVSRNVGEQYGRGTFDPDKLGGTDDATHLANEAVRTEVVGHLSRIWNKVDEILGNPLDGEFPFGEALGVQGTSGGLFDEIMQLSKSGVMPQDFKDRLGLLQRKWTTERSRVEGLHRDPAKLREARIEVDEGILRELQSLLDETGRSIAELGKEVPSPVTDSTIRKDMVRQQMDEGLY